MNRLTANLLLTAGLLLHIPVVLTRANASRGKAPTLPDGNISFAFYGAIDEPGEVRTVRAELRADQQLFVELLIPKLSPEQDLAEEDLPFLTIVSPSGQERVLRASRRETFDEPYTQTSYLSYLTGRFPAEEGTYTLSVSGSSPARFALAVGDDERPGEVLGVPIGSVEDVHHWYEAEASVIR
ncbi:hypothetical protein [Actinophytocola xanthii]|uniref:Uncharacterized protein n=1 Tax=Actinophytocola xanthii TaxID=1912961 RepID=A0A1Q8CMB8_9PSEU|nr:hypothetical protein [Actinophytocola xanthii]OLF15503.1 hypothetical protein BU204_21505 [Actinophytocola xanthii]